MAETTSVFKPHRGTKSVMDTYNTNKVLEDGELFVEGQGSTMGSGKAKIKIGDGSTAYSSLPYAIGDTSTDPITYTYTQHSTVDTCLSYVSSGSQLGTIIASLRRAIYLLNSNFQTGISTIVSTVNSKAGTSLATNTSPSTIASTITNMRIASSTVNYKHEYVSIVLKSSSNQSKYGDDYWIGDWLEMVAIIRKVGSGYGNLPQGGIYLDDVKCDAAYTTTSTYLLSGRVNVSSNYWLKVRAYCGHANATSSNTYTQGIRAYIFYT